jgi:hypothetical protein
MTWMKKCIICGKYAAEKYRFQGMPYCKTHYLDAKFPASWEEIKKEA